MDLLLLLFGSVAITLFPTIAAMKYMNRYETLKASRKLDSVKSIDRDIVTLTRREIEGLDAEGLFNLVETKLRNAPVRKPYIKL